MIRFDARSPLPWMALVGALALGAGPALAQDAALAGRLDRLERDLQVLQRQSYQSTQSGGGGDGLSTEGAASLYSKVTQIEEQMRDLVGQIEQLNYKIDQAKQRMDRMQADADFRFQSLEKGGPAANGQPADPTPAAPAAPTSGSTVGILGQTQSSGAPPAAAAPAPAPAEGAADAYRDAFNLLKKADYAGAETAFRAFLQKHGDTEYAGNAQYWLGETYYVRGQFQQAAVAFADGYKKYRKGPKAPDSLLKLGFSMRRLNQNEQACAALDQFLKEFGGAPKVQIDLAQKSRAEMKCR